MCLKTFGLSARKRTTNNESDTILQRRTKVDIPQSAKPALSYRKISKKGSSLRPSHFTPCDTGSVCFEATHAFKAIKHSGFMTIKEGYRREHICIKKSIFKMMKKTKNGNSVVGLEKLHKCDRSCLGPLSFDCHAVGEMVQLSEGCRLAEKKESTFKNGLVFSSRSVKIKERVRLRVLKDFSKWHGALRVGFTNVSPTDRAVPLPCMAIPDLTETPGHWAAPVPEHLCTAGSELEFWVSHNGTVHIIINTDSRHNEHQLLTGVDLSKPLWAMIDIYGQTCSVFLMGSERKQGFFTRRSCPAPEHLTSPNSDNIYSIPDVSSLCGNSVDSISCCDMEDPTGKNKAFPLQQSVQFLLSVAVTVIRLICS
ncbi:hypothetical protein PAMA_018294 [Pampus argenteus]